MAGILSGFSGFGGIGSALIKYGALFGIMLLIGLAIGATVIIIVLRKRRIKIFEVTHEHRLQLQFAVLKKRKGNNIQQFYLSKDKRFLPQFQQKDIFYTKKNDNLFLLKDNNGLYHSLRVPTYKQIKKWYEVVYGIDLDNVETETPMTQGLKNIYLLPNPHENLDWLADQVVESNMEFKDLEWWQHPNIMIAMSVAGAVMIQIVNLIFLYLLNKK